jgi:glycine/D-amino acid oxidase-like deaminating enzyme
VVNYGRSPWISGFPKSRVPAYPAHRGALESDVVVVGGGLTGCATAYALSSAGIKVVLLEGDRVGRAATGASAGWIGDDPGVGFVQLERAIGLRAARRAWQAWHRAGLDFAALLRRLSIRCGLEASGSVTVALTADQAAQLKREQKSRLDAGLDAPLLTARTIAGDIGLPAAAGIRARDGATIDPYRAALGLASAASHRGARFFERSAVKKITFTRKTVDVHTARGAIRARRVVIATGWPTPLFKALQRHFWFRDTYFALTAPVPAKTRRVLGERQTVVRDSASPPHIVRWVDGERLLVAGADSESMLDRGGDRVVVQRTGQLMYELSTLYPEISGIAPEYGWNAAYALTATGLPYIGPHRNYPHHLFAFGDASHTVTGAYLASRVLLRHHLEEIEPADDVFGFRLD